MKLKFWAVLVIASIEALAAPVVVCPREAAPQAQLAAKEVARYVYVRTGALPVIAPEMLPHMFDLFAQADQTLARSQGGLGIGLTLVRRLVDMHQGRIDVDSAPGKGSAFAVSLPTVAYATGM